VHSVEADKLSLVYGPYSWIKFRGTYSRAVRAPNITEAFSPVQQTYFNVYDPCDATNITANVNYAKNCAAAGIPAGFKSNLNASIVGQTSGNPNLSPEKSLSYTGGILFQPPIIPRLAVTVDYYSILIKDAITQVAAQDIINNCYNDAAGLNSQYCSLFKRNPTTDNIDFVQTTYVNAAELYTSGITLQATYSVGVRPVTSLFKYSSFLTGRLNTSLDVNYIFKLRDYPFQNNPGQVNILEGAITGTEGDVPQMRALLDTTYKQDQVQFTWQVRYLGRAARYDLSPGQADYSESTNYPYAGARFTHNMVLRYDLTGAATGMQLYIGCNDIFGELPPLGLVAGSSADASYDLGRYVFAGVRYRR
jgi:outer membrane receptor protein involved in Fe transport